ncbi:sulfotransferase family 2 domain-containing protein [Paracoccus seriniphilus]|uniref:sulfotransferase family 2 domain-containing protein n=1 Tax=Paracoccus seriniphilus TaxID=184748 RepID=UPI000B76F803|nr:sulfotransferase family 2 domain-containing protein [Paracoccus seriniphilus]WCR14143.1 sulfotransferase family 2 domain-containing protein [Paracoccus seriniphilus]
MLISHRHKFIYIKTHKTASTSIEGILEAACVLSDDAAKHRRPYITTSDGIVAGRNGGERPEDPLTAHSPAAAIRRVIGARKFKQYLKVYAVRNPYDKVVSWYWHVMPKDLRVELKEDFSEARKFFRNWLLMRPTLPTDLKFYRTPAGRFKAYQIRYESMNEDLQALADKLGFDLDTTAMPQWKTAARGHKDVDFENYYDPETRKVVEEAFSYDFKNFGYQIMKD